MFQYQGESCPVCHKAFTANDDIVVCPHCGTPHHRACYAETGHCANESRHGSGWSYQQEQQRIREEQRQKEAEERVRQAHQQGGILCSQCGTLNPPDGLFCIVCGNPLADGQKQNAGPQQGGFPFPPQGAPFVPPSPMGGVDAAEDLGGAPAKDYAAFVGVNVAYFLPRFKRFADGKAVAPNFCAFLFPGLYFLYRKIWSLGVVFTLLSLGSLAANCALYYVSVLEVPNEGLTELLYILSMAVALLQFVGSLLAFLLANRFYFYKATRSIQKCRSMGLDLREYTLALQKKGSVSMYAAAGGLIALSVGAMVGTYFLMLV